MRGVKPITAASPHGVGADAGYFVQVLIGAEASIGEHDITGLEPGPEFAREQALVLTKVALR